MDDQMKNDDKEKENEQPVSDTDQKNKKDSVSKESKTLPGFHMMLFVDSKNGMIKQMGIGQAAIEIILTCVIALIIVLAAGWGVSASHAHTMENEVKELTGKNETLTADNKNLTEKNDELDQKITALSNTVNIKTKTENKEKAEDQSAHEPTGFPLSASAAAPSEGDNKMVIYTASAGSNVIASGDGVVEDIAANADYGTVITIDHENGYKSMYYNAGDAMIKKGDKVVRGSVLFTVGESNVQLGYQISKDGANVDPMTLTKIDG